MYKDNLTYKSYSCNIYASAAGLRTKCGNTEQTADNDRIIAEIKICDNDELICDTKINFAKKAFDAIEDVLKSNGM